MILPERVLGRFGTRRTCLGVANGPTPARTERRSSFSSASLGSNPSRRMQKHTMHCLSRWDGAGFEEGGAGCAAFVRWRRARSQGDVEDGPGHVVGGADDGRLGAGLVRHQR